MRNQTLALGNKVALYSFLLSLELISKLIYLLLLFS